MLASPARAADRAVPSAALAKTDPVRQNAAANQYVKWNIGQVAPAQSSALPRTRENTHGTGLTLRSAPILLDAGGA